MRPENPLSSIRQISKGYALSMFLRTPDKQKGMKSCECYEANKNEIGTTNPECKLAGGGGDKRLSELLHNGDGQGLGLSRHPQPPGLRRRQQQHLIRAPLGRGSIMDKKVTKYFRDFLRSPIYGCEKF